MMNFEESVIDAIAGHILRSLLSEMPMGRRVRIDAIQVGLAIELANRLNVALKQEGKNFEDCEVVIGVLGKESKDEGFISPSLAIGQRNRNKKMLLFVPGTEAAAAQSIGANAFESISLRNLSLELIQSVRDGLLSELSMAGPARQLVRAARDADSLDALGFYLDLERLGLHQNAGKDLWKLGLLPDLGESPWERAEKNAAIAGLLVGNNRSVLTIDDRIAQTKLAKPQMARKVASLLNQALNAGGGWLKTIADDANSDLTFEKWTFLDDSSAEIQELDVLPFVIDGKVDARCKLRLDASDVLYAKSKVSVYWETKPSKIEGLGQWLIELVPPSSLGEDLNVLRSVKAKSEKRMATIDIELSDEEVEALYPRYVLRITAIDQSGAPMFLVTGSLARVESQDFAIESDGEIIAQSERAANATSLAEAYLSRVLDGKDSKEEYSPTWDLEGQIFTISSSAFEKTNLRVCNNVIALQRSIIRNAAIPLAFGGFATSGEVIEEFRDIPLSLPAAVVSKRKKFLEALGGAGDSRDTVEVANWTEKLRSSLDGYLTAYKNALEQTSTTGREDLLLLDTVTLEVQTSRGIVEGVLLLPTHPLRAAWVQQHDELVRGWAKSVSSLPKKSRRLQIEGKLASKITAANLPMFAGTRGASGLETISGLVYAEEFTHGSAFYTHASLSETRFEIQALSQALGLNVQTTSTVQSSTLLGERLASYRASRPAAPGLQINLVNPADGLVAADALRIANRLLGESASLGRLAIKAFTAEVPLAHPIPALEKLQSEIEADQSKATQNFLTPSCSLSIKSVSEMEGDTDIANISIVQGIANLEVARVPNHPAKSSSLNGLLNSTATVIQSQGDEHLCFTVGALGTANSKKASAITQAHLAYNKAMSAALALGEGVAGVALTVGEAEIRTLKTIHERSDWVCTLDRHIGLSLYENVLKDKLPATNILDYAPDFVDGIGDRLTVSTSDSTEIADVLLDAMQKLGLSDAGKKPEDLLKVLSSVSGRLALRLFKKDTMAMEAIGLAATVMHLAKAERLTNVILFPVDAHPDLFGVHAREGSESAQRCDLIVIGFSGKKYYLDFIEVKARTNGIEAGLEEKIAAQIDHTVKVLSRKLSFGLEDRIDGDLQWARWAGLLHFYADRSALHSFISKNELDGIHEAIDSIEKNRTPPEIRRSGFIFSLNGNNEVVSSPVGSANIELINAETAADLGLTTTFALDEQQNWVQTDS